MADKRQGLITSAGITVPLKEINVSVTINGFVADIQSTSLYVNKEDSPIEAIFIFPVDDQSAVYKFEADIDGRHLIAECHEKGQAKEIYDDAVSQGITSMLLEEDESSGDIFRCKLGNLHPKGEAKLSMGFVTELDIEPDGKVKFTLPTILNPRYSPGITLETNCNIDSSVTLSMTGLNASIKIGSTFPNKISTAKTFRYDRCQVNRLQVRGSLTTVEDDGYVTPNAVPYRFQFQLMIRGPQRIKGVQGQISNVTVEYLEDRKAAKVSLAEEFKFDHDLCVLVEYEECNAPQIILEKGSRDSGGLLKEDILMVNFVFKTREDIPKSSPGEFIFIIDRSGSMQGGKIENVKETLLLFLKSLPVDCYFNVIGFGSRFESLFPCGSQKYNAKNLKLALDLQTRMTADLGGTEILSPLQHVYNQALIDNFPRQLFLLTDGEVSNVTEVVALVRANSQHTRVFAVGIGHGASTALVRGLAEAGKGKEVFVTDTDRLQPKVISLLKCAMQPVATEVEMIWELPPTVTKMMMPQELPYVYFGERQIVYLLLSGTDNVDPGYICSMILKGKMVSTPFEYKETFTFHVGEEKGTSIPIHRLAAKAQIRQLQLNDAHKDQIILVSKAANVISKHTAFVMVDTKGQIVSDFPRTITVPRPTFDRFPCNFRDCSVMVSSELRSYSCYEGTSPGLRQFSTWSMVPMARNSSRRSSNFLGNLFDRIKRRFRKADTLSERGTKSLAMPQARMDDPKDEFVQDEISPTHERSVYSILIEIIRLQNFQGTWDFSTELLDLLGAQADILKRSMPTQDDAVVATVHVIAWLRKHHSERRDEWQMLEEKALDWLQGQDLQGHSAEELISKVTI